MRLIAVGKLRDEPEAQLFAAYRKRLRPPLALCEIADAKGSDIEIRRREADAILEHLGPRDFLIALDSGGTAPGSEAFAVLLEKWRTTGRPLVFVVGGAEGLDPSVLARADGTLSLGAMTWPHRLVRVMLAEQIFRAQAIASGHPCHRAWRPNR